MAQHPVGPAHQQVEQPVAVEVGDGGRGVARQNQPAEGGRDAGKRGAVGAGLRVVRQSAVAPAHQHIQQAVAVEVHHADLRAAIAGVGCRAEVLVRQPGKGATIGGCLLVAAQKLVAYQQVK